VNRTEFHWSPVTLFFKLGVNHKGNSEAPHEEVEADVKRPRKEREETGKFGRKKGTRCDNLQIIVMKERE